MQRLCSVLLPLTLTSVFVLTSGHALADDIEDSIELQEESKHAISGGVFLGGLLLADDHEFYDTSMTTQQPLDTISANIGLRLGYMPIPYAGAEVEGNLSFPAPDEGSRTTLFGFRAHLLGQIPMKVTPFVLAGFGVMGISSDGDVLGSDTDPVGHFGAGAKFRVTSKWVARADLRLLVAPKARALDAVTAHGEFLLRLSYDFYSQGPHQALPVDLDGDGFIGEADLCPTDPGVDPDGCPLKDEDGDGIIGDADACPLEAENLNGFEDEDGCPDVLDTDGDGIADPTDGCIEVKEDMDGFEDEDGCPEDDNDKDSIFDNVDRCPLEPGPIENRGCPDTDRDGDTVIDRLDNCPDEKGSVEEQGCIAKQRVVITAGSLEILDKVYFQTNKDIIQRRSYPILNNVAEVLLKQEGITMVQVGGHTDDVGNDADNLVLSQKRAEAVARYLVGRGVAYQRLTPKGFGEDVPAAEGKSRKARQSNRRVEFKIITE